MSILDRLADKFREARELSQNRRELRDLVLKAVEDGILTDRELQQIERRQVELGLLPDEVKRFRLEVFTAALKAVKEDARLTPQEEESLQRIATYFGVPHDAVGQSKEELARYRLLYEIESGNLPRFTVTNVFLRKGEIVHWSEPSSILEEKVLRRGYVGGSRGFSFRIAKGVTYRIGAHRGQLVAETGIVPVSAGELILTSRRLIFRGSQKSISCAWDKLLDMEFFADGIRFSQMNRSKPVTVQFHQKGNVEVIGALISYIANHFDGS